MLKNYAVVEKKVCLRLQFLSPSANEMLPNRASRKATLVECAKWSGTRHS